MTKQKKSQDISSPPVDEKDAERIEEYDHTVYSEEGAERKDS